MQAQLAVGAMGFPILCEVVREEREDLDMLRGALECLVLALAHGEPPKANPRRPQAWELLLLSSRILSTRCSLWPSTAQALDRCARGRWPMRTQEAHVSAINSELFARGKGHVSMLLALLEDEPVGVNDFYVRYYTLQLLTALGASPHRLHEVRPLQLLHGMLHLFARSHGLPPEQACRILCIMLRSLYGRRSWATPWVWCV